MDQKFIHLSPNTDKGVEKNERKDIPQKETREENISTESKKKKNVLTSIQSQKKKGRYNIFIDGEYAFPVDENILIKYLLRKGMVLDKDLINKIKKEDLFYKAYSRALNYLSYGLRSEEEVRKDLIDKDFFDQAEDVIEKLKDQKLVNDLTYAQSYFRTQATVNYKGPKNIEYELLKKSVSPHYIELAKEEYSIQDQEENALHLVEKKEKQIKKSSHKDKVQKIRLYLVQKGYSKEVIDLALTRYHFTVDEDAEYDNLKREGQKALKRYQRKYQGYELKQKLKAFLYNKGFDSEIINRFINEEADKLIG